jgi:Imidazoleglycerol-phosphate dehydratase
MKMNKGVVRDCLFIPVSTLVSFDGKMPVFKPDVFSSLSSIYRGTECELVLLCGDLAESDADYVVETFRAQGIAFDAVASVFDEKRYSAPPYEKGKLYETGTVKQIENSIFIPFASWKGVASYFALVAFDSRTAEIVRNTAETRISLSLNLDGSGKGKIESGNGFFDHMLAQIVRHARIDCEGKVSGDYEVDEHHSVEDLAIVLGEATGKALGDKRGINRYGADLLMMDDVVATVALDFSGRSEFLFKADFRRPEVGGFPTEMFSHFFKSFSNEAKCNLYMEVTDGNTHHMAEALFKAFARAYKVAVRRIPGSSELPSTKGVL